MRAIWVYLGGLLLAAILAGQEEIPRHPRFLSFAEPTFIAPDPADHRIELPGGAVGFVSTDHSLPLVDVAVALRVGSFLDPADQAGLASLTGSLVRRAGAGDQPAALFDDQVAALGARLNSFAGIQRGGASLEILTDQLEAGLALLFSVLEHPRFDADRVEATRRTLTENMRRRNEDALGILEREWEWLLWGMDHYATRPLTGTTLAAIRAEDMREHQRRYWRPDNMVFAVSGDIGREEAQRLLTERLQSWQIEAASTGVPWPPVRSTFEPEPGVYLIDKDVPQAKVRLGLLDRPAEPWSERDSAVLRVMSEILGGGGAISRISGRLRTAEGLVYRANASFDTGELWTGEFRVFFEAANANVARAVELCLEEIRRLQSATVHPRELEAVKETLLSELRQRFDTAEEIAGYLAEDEFLARPSGYWQRRYELIVQVTADDVLRAAVEHLRLEELIVFAVGRIDEIDPPRADGPGRLEAVTGYSAVRLPLRDPLTMQVR